MTDSLVVLLHLCDSLFPIGSFAHSDGLEAATTGGGIRTATDLRAWMEATLGEFLRCVEGPAVCRAWHAAADRRLDVIAALDDEVYAMRPSSAGRESTRAMGGRLLKTWQQIRPHESTAMLLDLRPAVVLPVAFGVVTAASEVRVAAAVEAFMYTRLAATVSAAMRLMPIGQHEAHALLADALSRVGAVASAAVADRSPLRSFTPVLDVTVMSQQYIGSRLFKS